MRSLADIADLATTGRHARGAAAIMTKTTKTV
jgi:alkylated DNA nucleotide flippase Atl1